MKKIGLVCAAEMYKVHEPLTLADVLELGKADGNLVYLELRNRWQGRLYDGFYEPVSEIDGNGVRFNTPGTGTLVATFLHGYNKQWRCWLRRPTSAETEVAPWR